MKRFISILLLALAAIMMITIPVMAGPVQLGASLAFGPEDPGNQMPCDFRGVRCADGGAVAKCLNGRLIVIKCRVGEECRQVNGESFYEKAGGTDDYDQV
ncbi:hypothetical protein BG003_011739 [Podila horticola]|nr:hypothetical protein BG003_011739 [Podila horticola]